MTENRFRPIKPQSSKDSSLKSCTSSCSSTAALVQHVEVELALADVAAVVVDAILEGLGRVATLVISSIVHWSHRCSSLTDNSLMLNGTGTHHSINSPVRHGTSSTESHALSNGGPNPAHDTTTAALGGSRWRSWTGWRWWVSHWSSTWSRAGRPSSSAAAGHGGGWGGRAAGGNPRLEAAPGGGMDEQKPTDRNGDTLRRI